MGSLQLQRRRNLDGFLAILSPLSLVILLEGEYLGGFKILDTDSFMDVHRWCGWHFLRRSMAASLPSEGDCNEVEVLLAGPGPGEECLRVYVADSLNSKSARLLRHGRL